MKIHLLLLTLFPCLLSAQPGYPDTDYTGYFRRETGWQAGDATVSVPLPDGRVLWLFGDSFIDRPYNPADTSLPCQFLDNNALLIQNPNIDPADLVYHTTFEPETPGHHFWPGKGFYSNNKVYIFLFERSGNSFIGSRYAELSYPDLQLLGTYSIPNPEGIEFGKSAFVDPENEWLYVFGNRFFPGFGVHRYYASRCPLNNLMQSWTYWDGSAWAGQPNLNVHLLTPAVGNPSFSVFPYEDRYYLLSQDNGYLTCGAGRDIRLYVSDLAQGPFTSVGLMYTVQDTYNGIYLATYNAHAHPDLGGDLLVSYNVNDVNQPGSGCPRQCNSDTRRNADTYRPKFFRIPMSVLPVTWLSFTAQKLDRGMLLEWATGSETGASHFEAQRSADGKDFEKIGIVQSAGETSAHRQYHLTDPAPLPGVSYYRIKQVDLDGKFQYSKTISFQNEDENAFQAVLFPNPAPGGRFFIRLNGALNAAFELTVNDSNGKTVFYMHDETTGDETIEVGMPLNLPAGVYWVQIKGRDEVLVRKVLVQPD